MKRFIWIVPWIGMAMVYGGIIAEWMGVHFKYTAPIAIAGFLIVAPFHWKVFK